jgi:tetratricopeptide (TPR) repeat protein
LWERLAIRSRSRNPQQASSSQQADALFAESKWEQAAGAFSEITAKEPANGSAWQHLGKCDIQLHRYDDALNAFQHVELI